MHKHLFRLVKRADNPLKLNPPRPYYMFVCDANETCTYNYPGFYRTISIEHFWKGY